MNQIVAPLRRKYHLTFLDFVKPDFQGAVLCALAVVPHAVRELFQQASLDIGWQLLRTATSAVSFGSASDTTSDLGLASRIDDAQLGAAERNELQTWILDEEAGVSFAPSSLSDSLRSRLCKTGLALYSLAHRAVAAKAGAAFFSLEPDEAESQWASQLAQSQHVDVVLTGHTHAARFWRGTHVLYLNSGTWIWLLRLPHKDATLDEWSAFLAALRQNPELRTEGEHRLRKERLLSVIHANPQPDGSVRFALSVCEENGELRVLRETVMPAPVGGQSYKDDSHV